MEFGYWSYNGLRRLIWTTLTFRGTALMKAVVSAMRNLIFPLVSLILPEYSHMKNKGKSKQNFAARVEVASVTVPAQFK